MENGLLGLVEVDVGPPDDPADRVGRALRTITNVVGVGTALAPLVAPRFRDLFGKRSNPYADGPVPDAPSGIRRRLANSTAVLASRPSATSAGFGSSFMPIYFRRGYRPRRTPFPARVSRIRYFRRRRPTAPFRPCLPARAVSHGTRRDVAALRDSQSVQPRFVRIPAPTRPVAVVKWYETNDLWTMIKNDSLVALVNDPAVGNGDNFRMTDRITMLRVLLSAHIQNNGDGATAGRQVTIAAGAAWDPVEQYSTVNIAFVYDMAPTGVLPTYGDIFQYTDRNQFLNPLNRIRFRVLWTQLVHFTAADMYWNFTTANIIPGAAPIGLASKLIQETVSLNISTTFKPNSTTGIGALERGALYFVAGCSNHTHLSWRTRVTFVDAGAGPARMPPAAG